MLPGRHPSSFGSSANFSITADAKNPHQYRKFIGINAGFVESARGGGRNERLIT